MQQNHRTLVIRFLRDWRASFPIPMVVLLVPQPFSTIIFNITKFTTIITLHILCWFIWTRIFVIAVIISPLLCFPLPLILLQRHSWMLHCCFWIVFQFFPICPIITDYMASQIWWQLTPKWHLRFQQNSKQEPCSSK